MTPSVLPSQNECILIVASVLLVILFLMVLIDLYLGRPYK